MLALFEKLTSSNYTEDEFLDTPVKHEVEVEIVFTKKYNVSAFSKKEAKLKVEEKIMKQHKTYRRQGLNFVSCSAIDS
ncbi:MAG TPA: hypothetical protein DCW74_04940 [Alteromonas australica]|uniref:Uncharacterized protein n=1 Tax=Alteromonas australica TaxID=589873 RepID=A0A350P1A1_9ALTE|nr:hypothetical protein [Alteromonas australica]